MCVNAGSVAARWFPAAAFRHPIKVYSAVWALGEKPKPNGWGAGTSGQAARAFPIWNSERLPVQGSYIADIARPLYELNASQ
jgi:hypothetical protein